MHSPCWLRTLTSYTPVRRERELLLADRRQLIAEPRRRQEFDRSQPAATVTAS